jgi:hypothetical protein
MLRPSAAPIWEQFLIFVLGPPAMASLCWLMSRGWAHTIQGVVVSDRTKQRQMGEFWVLLIVMYLFSAAVVLYEWLT